MASPSSMDPYRPLDDGARGLARDLLASAAHGALGTIMDGAPMVTRTGCLWVAGQGMLLLVSDLSDHAKALALTPACSLLVGEAGAKGDPLTHPRFTLVGTAEEADKAALRGPYLAARPKAKLYYDFTDFRLMQIAVSHGMLNGGFGKAYRFTAADLDALPS